jgi:hypothetical protein
MGVHTTRSPKHASYDPADRAAFQGRIGCPEFRKGRSMDPSYDATAQNPPYEPAGSCGSCSSSVSRRKISSSRLSD